MSEVQFPIYVLAKDCGEVYRFNSLRDLQWIEAIDVENDEYEAWDASGRIVQLLAEAIGVLKAGSVSVKNTAKVEDPERFAQVRSRCSVKH